MKIILSDVTLNIEEYPGNSSGKNYIFFLHGFTGSAGDWNEIIPSLKNNFNFIALDLIGHGRSDSPGNLSLYSADSMAEQIHQTILYFTNKPIIIAGYSMGGRAALSYASKHQHLLKGLTLESTNAGIMVENSRRQRIEDDKKLAEFIETHTIEEFVDYWSNISLFKSQLNLPKEKLDIIKKTKLLNSKTGLANCLRGFSTGKMPALINDIKTIMTKTFLISGELDLKFTGINAEMVNIFPDASHMIIKNAGHNVHLEKPSSFINVINDFLDKF